MDSKRNTGSSKKKTKQPLGAKGKKMDEAERAVAGAGWTTAATQKFLDCQNDEERMQQLFAMFSINDQQYKFDAKSTATIDFHLSNSLFCEENKLDLQQTQFVCRTMDRLLQHAVQSYSQQLEENDQQLPNVEKLRTDLFAEFRAAFAEINPPGEYIFSIELTQKIVEFVGTSFIKPIRLLLYQFCHVRRQVQIPEVRKVFTPIQPVPLSECEEQFPAIVEEMEFKPPVIPKDGICLEDAKQMIQKYTENIIATINKRYDALDEMAQHMQVVPDM